MSKSAGGFPARFPNRGRRSTWSRRDARLLVVDVVATTAASVAFISALVVARQALLLIYMSLLLAIGLSPVIRLLERQRIIPIGSRAIPRWLAILCVYVSIVGVLTGIGLMIFPIAVEQAQGLISWLPQAMKDGQRLLVVRGILAKQVSVQQIVQEQIAPTAPTHSDLLGTVFTTVSQLIGGAFGVVTMLILTFYLLIEAESLLDGIVRLFPQSERLRVKKAGREIAAKVSSWLTMQLILAATIGVTTAIGLGLIGVPYFYVLALLAAVGEFVPYIGPVLAAIPGISLAFASSWEMGLGVAVFYFLQQQTENYLLLPKLVGDGVGLSSTLVIIALLLGHSLLGVLGAVLAIPTAAILQVMLQRIGAVDEA